MVIINPGSHLPDNPDGWTNTYEQARREAYQWLNRMISEGFSDVELIDNHQPIDDGQRWEFIFRHKITGIEVKLHTHGIDDMVAYRKQAIFEPRVYWHGSSSSEPKLEDFAAEGFAMTKTFRHQTYHAG